MPLAQTLAGKLNAAQIDGTVVSAAENGDRLLVRVDQAGALALSLFELRLETDKLTAAPMPHVKQVATQLTEKITYLLEPICPVESDAEACVVQLRSTKPQQGVEGVCYYELLVKTGGAIGLCRYEKAKGALRREVAMNLTKEVVTRLAADFLAAVD
ncbi:hypothetical protein Pla123a_30720 [Posidoniimonas polymericola]|uniref:Uncharacterized protein n=1 Tax=Posidoniimonas polymericola TaxID=2528002 RepID=A0A5C5YL16_9BACT|nr:hypothetical protein [Posidoniimonas polymericola]TWT75562.1 hypothetical protein Pla123a_30720 [Posidoniimonas polymericola]